DGEAGALALPLAGGADASPVHLDEVTHDGQAQAEAAVNARAAAVRLAEPLEEVGQEIRPDPRSGVLDGQMGPVAVTDQPDVDLAPRRGELDGIGEEVADDLLEPSRVAGHRPGRGVEVRRELHVAGVRGWTHRVHDALDGGRQIDGLQIDRQLAADDARHVEQVRDDLRLVTDVALDDLQAVRSPGRIEASRPQHAHP